MRYLGLLLSLMMIPILSNGQKAKLINSVRQDWSGGIAGRYGSNYSFAIEFYNCKKDPVPDTLWVGDNAVAIYPSAPSNITRSRLGDTLRFDIKANISKNDELNSYYPHEPSEKKAPPIKYKGVALLSYKYKGQRRYFVIERIMRTMEPVAYP